MPILDTFNATGQYRNMSFDKKESQVLEKYRILLQRIDEKFAETHAQHRQAMQCGRGCHACCLPDIDVFAIEQANIEGFLNNHPEIVQALVALENENPHQGTRCRFLNADGDCLIYEVRPVICRSHGAPHFLPPSDSNAQPVYDACPLNFVGQKLEDLPAADFFNLLLLNETLVALNFEFTGTKAGDRYRLAIETIMESNHDV